MLLRCVFRVLNMGISIKQNEVPGNMNKPPTGTKLRLKFFNDLYKVHNFFLFT